MAELVGGDSVKAVIGGLVVWATFGIFFALMVASIESTLDKKLPTSQCLARGFGSASVIVLFLGLIIFGMWLMGAPF